MSGNFIGLNGYNKVIDNFNNNRPWLKEPMEKIGYLDGADIGVGLAFKRLFMDFSLNFTDKAKCAEHDSMGLETRELMVRNNFMAFTFGTGFSTNKTFMGFGLMTQYGTLNTLTKIYTYNDRDDFKWTKIDKNTSARIGPALVISTGPPQFRLMLNLHYCFGLSKNTAAKVDEYLNQNNYNFNYPKEFNFRDNNFGFNLSVAVFIGGR